ncbi:MAG: hypothetical protein WCT23_10305 [Candidatus Neomarinimicrobiota bacterium]|nr:hypothetical protein [Candidatus Paceibacterota bacterium]
MEKGKHPGLIKIRNDFEAAEKIEPEEIAGALIEEFGLPFVGSRQITTARAKELCSQDEEGFIVLYKDIPGAREVIDTLKRRKSDIVWGGL